MFFIRHIDNGKITITKKKGWFVVRVNQNYIETYNNIICTHTHKNFFLSSGITSPGRIFFIQQTFLAFAKKNNVSKTQS
jgi:hypothetical protein